MKSLQGDCLVRLAICLGINALGLVTQSIAAESTASPESSKQAASKAVTLPAFIDQVLADGPVSRVPSPLAELLGVAKDTPDLYFSVSADQSTDGMSHLFQLMVERAPDTGEAKPISLYLCSDRGRTGNTEGYDFKASLDGKLEKVILISAKNDAQGKAIKGSGTPTEKDINSPEIKKRFQHELDLWLKRAYLKKEWKSAEFVNGVLQKKPVGAK